MARLDNSLLNRIGQQKAFDDYGTDFLNSDGRTVLQQRCVDKICKLFPVNEIVQHFYNYPDLYYFISLKTGHLLKFVITPFASYSFSTVPVLGGVNCAYVRPFNLKRKILTYYAIKKVISKRK